VVALSQLCPGTFLFGASIPGHRPYTNEFQATEDAAIQLF